VVSPERSFMLVCWNPASRGWTAAASTVCAFAALVRCFRASEQGNTGLDWTS
jgi:hypothetical protein